MKTVLQLLCVAVLWRTALTGDLTYEQNFLEGVDAYNSEKWETSIKPLRYVLGVNIFYN